MTRISIIVFLVAVLGPIADAQDLDQLERSRDYRLRVRHSLRLLDLESPRESKTTRVEEAAESEIAEEQAYRCVRVFGHKDYCRCVAENIASGTFGEWMFAVMDTKKELKYDEMSEEERKVIDAQRKARDMCVSEVWAERTP